MNSNYTVQSNGVNELHPKREYLSPGRARVVEQAQPDRHPVTAHTVKRKWSVEDNKTAMEFKE